MAIEDKPDLIHAYILDVASQISMTLFGSIKSVGPVSIPRRDDKELGHFLSRAIIGQQLSTKAAASIWGKVEAAASSAKADVPHFFDQNCNDVLRECGVSRNKIKALRSLHEAVDEEWFCAQALRVLDHETRSKMLGSIWGIGQWTCDMASIFYFRCPDVWPESDVTVQKLFGRLIGRSIVTQAVSHFAPFRSYVALAMWKISDTSP